MPTPYGLFKWLSEFAVGRCLIIPAENPTPWLCCAHVRLKLYDISQGGLSPIADEAITTIQSLYVI